MIVRRKIIRPSGWTGKMSDKFLVKGSVYGQRYFCTDCGNDALGTDFNCGTHHMTIETKHLWNWEDTF